MGSPEVERKLLKFALPRRSPPPCHGLQPGDMDCESASSAIAKANADREASSRVTSFPRSRALYSKAREKPSQNSLCDNAALSGTLLYGPCGFLR
jgi:hypothetical protein